MTRCTAHYRLNATHEQGKTFNDGSLRRNSLSLEARLTQDLRWDFDTLYQHRAGTGQTPSISTVNYVGSSLPSVVSGANQDLLSAGQHLSNTLQPYSTGLQYRLAPDWTLVANYSHSTATRSRNEGIPYLTDTGGDYDDYRSDTREGHRFDQGQALLQGKLRTGAFEHQMVLGASWQKQGNDYSGNSIYQQIGTGNLDSPNTNSYFSATDFSLYRDSDITQRAVFASDTVKLSAQWDVLAGLRRTNDDQNGYNLAGARRPRPGSGTQAVGGRQVHGGDAAECGKYSEAVGLRAGQRRGQLHDAHWRARHDLARRSEQPRQQALLGNFSTRTTSSRETHALSA